GRAAGRGGGGGSQGGGSESWLLTDDSNSGSSGSTGGGGSGGGGQVVNFTEGFTYYKQKQFDRAIQHFQKAAKKSGGSVGQRAKQAASTIETFKKVYSRARESLNAGNWAQARDRLRRALQTDRKVADSGFFTSELNTKLARATAELGKARLKDGQYAQAYNKLKDAKQYDTGADAVRDLRRQLEKEATSLYIQAKQKRKTSPGKTAELCRQIMSMLPEDAETYKKAEKLLSEI
ncbi:MAG: tetratricopeptide repeat protein, partial [Bradymonadaceae bacterium]